MTFRLLFLRLVFLFAGKRVDVFCLRWLLGGKEQSLLDVAQWVARSTPCCMVGRVFLGTQTNKTRCAFFALSLMEYSDSE